MKTHLRLLTAATAALFAFAAFTPAARAQHVKLETPENHGGFFCFAPSPDGTLVAGGTGTVSSSFNGRKQAPEGGEVILWDAMTGKIRKTLGQHDETPEWLAWSADGGLLASASEDDGVVKVWNTKSGALRATLKTGGKLAKSTDGSELLCAFSADGRTVATVVEKESPLGTMQVRTGDTLALWDVGTGKARWQVQDSWVAVLTLSPDGKALVAYAVKVTWKAGANDSATGEYSDARLIAWDAATGKEKWRVDAKQNYPHTLAFVPDAGLLAVDGRNFTRIDIATGQTGSSIGERGGKNLRDLTFSADGKRFVGSDFMGNNLTWGDTATGKITATQKFPDRIGDTAFSRDLKIVVGKIGFDPAIVTLAPEPSAPK